MVTALKSPRRVFWGIVFPILAIALLAGGILVANHLADRAGHRKSAAYSMAEARRALVRGDAAVARDRLREALERNPELVEAEVELARLDIGEGRFATARASLDSLVERQPSDFPTRLLLAELCFARGDLARARASAQIAVDLRGDVPAARLLLGRILLRLDEPLSAAREIREALRLDGTLVRPYLELAEAEALEVLRYPGSNIASRESALVEGMGRLRVRLEESPDDPSLLRVLLRLASTRGAAGRTETEAAIRRLLEVSDGDPVSHLVAIHARWAAGDGPGTVGLLERSAGRFPDDARFTLVQAAGSSSLGLRRGARLLLDRAIEAAEEAPGSAVDPGPLSGRVEKAFRAWEEGGADHEFPPGLVEGTEALLERDPSGPDALRLAGRVRLATGRLRAAADALERLVVRGTGERDDLYYLGLARLGLGDARAARVLVSKELDAGPLTLLRLVKIAEVHLEAGDPATARRLLSGLSAIAGNFSPCRLLRARIAAAEGGDPLPHLEAALQDTRAPDVALRVALLRRERGDADAERTLTELLASDPERLDIRLALCRFRRSTGDWRGALEVLPEESRKDPAALLERTEYWLSRNCVAEARSIFDSVGPTVRAPGLLVRGSLLLAEGRPRDARAAFETASELAGARDEATLGLARALLAEGRPRDATDVAAALLESPEHGPSAREIVGEAALVLAEAPPEQAAGVSSSPIAGLCVAEIRGREEAAIRRVASVMETRDLAARDRLRLAALRLTLRDPGGALEALAVARSSGYEGPRLDRLAALASLRAGRPEEALAAFRAAAAEAPEDPASRVGLLEALLALSRNEEAVEFAEAACREFPDRPRLHLLRGIALDRLDHRAEAEGAFRLALEADPASVPAADALASLLTRCDRGDEALTLLEDAVRDFRGSEGHWFLLAGIRDRRGDRSGATNALRLGLAQTDSLRLAAVLADRLLRPPPPARPDPAAIDVLCRALELAPDQAGLLAMLGEAFLLTGREVEGRAALAQALQVGPSPALAEMARRVLK